jgi:hypothetical protein
MQLTERVRSWFDASVLGAQTEEVSGRCGGRVFVPESTRHPFHREVLDILDGLLDRVGRCRPTPLSRSTTSPPGGRTCRGFVALHNEGVAGV